MANESLQDPKINYPKDDLDLPFADYISQCKTLITHNRLDLKQYDDPNKIININSPYELKPQATTPKSPYGALLIHGLLDSPFIMQDIGLQLQAQGLLVRSILLPGHGTVPGALLNIQYEDWEQTVRYGIHSLAKEVDQVFLVGFSTGASLSLLHILKNTASNIAGLILLAPAIKIASAFDFTQHWPSYIGKYWARANWLYINEENDYAKYQSITFNAGYQVYRLAQKISQLSKTKKINHRLLTIISQDDQTVSSTATLNFLKQYAPKESQLLLYTNTPPTNKNPNIITRPANYPNQHIINISHVALPTSPENFHYGKKGDYIYASHIEENLQNEKYNLYGTMNNLQNKFNTTLYKLNLLKHPQLRLSFNPDFKFMQKTITHFVTTASALI